MSLSILYQTSFINCIVIGITSAIGAFLVLKIGDADYVIKLKPTKARYNQELIEVEDKEGGEDSNEECCEIKCCDVDIKCCDVDLC